MSKLTENGKHLILENTIVSYSPRDDTIHITSADPDLLGEPFHISLNQSTDTENTLRNLLIQNGVIKEDLIGSNLPETLSHPEDFNEDPQIFDLGVSRQGTVSWNPVKHSHLAIYGYTGSGKTVVANNILFQALKNQDVWDIYCFDPKKVEYSHIKDKLNNPDNYVDTRGAAIEIIEKIDNNIKEAKVMNPTLLFIDSLDVWMEFDEAAEFHKAMFLRSLNNILQKGRAAGVHIVFTSQRPNSIGSYYLRADNFGSAIIMGRNSEVLSKNVLGSNIAVRTPHIKGRGLFKFENDKPTQFQSYYYPLSEFKNI